MFRRMGEEKMEAVLLDLRVMFPHHLKTIGIGRGPSLGPCGFGMRRLVTRVSAGKLQNITRSEVVDVHGDIRSQQSRFDDGLDFGPLAAGEAAADARHVDGGFASGCLRGECR